MIPELQMLAGQLHDIAESNNDKRIYDIYMNVLKLIDDVAINGRAGSTINETRYNREHILSGTINSPCNVCGMGQGTYHITVEAEGRTN